MRTLTAYLNATSNAMAWVDAAGTVKRPGFTCYRREWLDLVVNVTRAGVALALPAAYTYQIAGKDGRTLADDPPALIGAVTKLWAIGVEFDQRDIVFHGAQGYRVLKGQGHTATAADEPGTGVNQGDYWEEVDHDPTAGILQFSINCNTAALLAYLQAGGTLSTLSDGASRGRGRLIDVEIVGLDADSDEVEAYGQGPVAAILDIITGNEQAALFNPSVLHVRATTNPTVDDDAADGFSLWSTWANTSTGVLHVCTDISAGAAVWETFATLEDIQAIGYLGTAATTELTIAAGAITPTAQHHTLDTEADAATDELATIATWTGFLMLRLANPARIVTLTHGTGADQITCPGAANLPMDYSRLYLLHRAAVTDPWRLVGGAGSPPAAADVSVAATPSSYAAATPDVEAHLAGIDAALGGIGTGDMLAATYDPTEVGGDAFDMDNMADGTTKKAMTATERSKLSGIEDNATADQSGAEIKTAYENEADTNAFDDAAAAKLAAIEAGAQVNTVTSVFGETGAVDVASLTEETTPADADLILLEKAAAGGFRKLQVGNLPAGAGGTQIDLSALTIAELGQLAEYLAVQDWALTPPTITNGVYAKFENNMTDEAGRQTMTPSGGAYAADWAVGGYSRKGGSLNFSGNTDDFVFDGDFCLAFVAKGGESQTVSIDFIDEYWTAPWSFYLYWEDSGFPSPAYIMWGPGGFYYVELADLGADPARIEVSRSGSTIKLWVNGVLAATETDGATWGAGGGVDTFDIYLSSGAYLDEFVVNKGTAWHTTAYAPYALAQSVVIGETKLNDAGTGANDLWSAEQIASELAVLDAAKFDVADVATDLDYYEAGQVLEATLAVDRSLGFAVSGLVEDDDDGKIVVSKAKYGPGMSVGVDFVNEWSSLYRGDGRLQMTYEPRGGTPVYDETFEGWKVAETAGSGHIRGAVWYCGRIGEVAPRSAAFAGDAYGDDFVISYQAHRNATGVPASLQYVQDGTQVWKLYWFSDTTVRLDFLGANYDWTGLTVAADAWQWLLVERHEGVLYLAVDGTRHATTHAETGGVANYPVYTAPVANSWLTDTAEGTGIVLNVGNSTATTYYKDVFVTAGGLLRYLHLNATVLEGEVDRRAILSTRRYRQVPVYAADTGSADAYACAASAEEYYAGLPILLLVGNTNTGAATLDVDGMGAKDIKTGTGAALSGGELVAGNVVMLVYNGMSFNLTGG